MASGKSTIINELLQSKFFKRYVFIDTAYLKDIMLKYVKKKDRKLAIETTKKAMIIIFRKIMPKKFNILTQEISSNFINKSFKKEIKKYNYKIKSFYLDCSFETAKKRWIKRETAKYVKLNHAHFEKMHKKHARIDNRDCIINTEKNSPKKAAALIIKEINKYVVSR